MTILKHYKCVKSNDEKRFAVGEIYPLYKDNINYIVDNSNRIWPEKEFPLIEEYWGVEFTELNKNEMYDIKEGQTFICKRDDLDWWTLGKEYQVVFDEGIGLVIVDDDGYKWYLPNYDLLNRVFKLKEKTLDLNKLTTAELREYIDILENKEKADRLLNEFTERMTK